MNYFFKGLLTSLISLFVLSGCTNPSGIGLDSYPGGELVGVLDSSARLSLVTQRDDAAQTISIAQNASLNVPSIPVFQLPVGQWNDPVIGNVQAGLALSISRISGDSRIPEGAILDSAVLVLRYGSVFSGDTLADNNYEVTVRQLAERFDQSTSTSITKAWQTSDEIVGQRSLARFNLRDSIVVTTLSNGRDSIIRAPAQLRIPLSNEFIDNLFSSAQDSTSFNADQGFQERIKGFYVSMGSQGTGGLATIALDDINALEVRYKVPGDEESMDTVFRRYTIRSTGQTSQDLLKSSVSWEFNDNVQQQLSNQESSYSSVFLQGLGGLRSRVVIGNLDSLANRPISVNKAELMLPVDEVLQGAVAPPSRLTLFVFDIGGRRQPVPDGDLRFIQSAQGQASFVGDQRNRGIQGFGGFYDRDKKAYVFNITSFVQDMISGKITNPELHISVASFSPFQNQSIPYWPDANAPNRVVLGNSSQQNFPGKLFIYYSQLP